MRKIVTCLVMCACLALLFSVGHAHADTTEGGVYGKGSYGSCTYGSCSITLTSSGAVSIDVTPASTGKCTVHSDTATVQTGNSEGYTLTMTASTTDTALTGTNDSIPASSGTAASPATLGANTWGYRVDGLGSFGNGPTTAQDSEAIPGVTFAGVPASNGASAAIAANDQAVETGEATIVWYGACANTSIAAGTYSATVTYTAVAN